jgi:two-component system NtrC family sensor kinase
LASETSEIGELAHSFDEMAAALERQTAQRDEAEAKYRALVEQSLVGVYLVRSDRIEFMNEACAAIFGYRPEEMVGWNPIDLVHPEDRALVATNITRRVSGAVDSLRYIVRGLRKDGATIWCEVFGRRVEYRSQPAILGTLLDITERRTAEEELRRVNRALTVLSLCNETLIRAIEEHVLLQTICRTIVDVGGHRFAWVGFAEHDEAKTVRPVAQAGYEDGYLAVVNFTWAETDAPTAVGSAIRSGKSSIIDDFSTAPAADRRRVEAIRRGYGSAIALPLRDGDRAFGALAIYAVEAYAFGAEEVRLLTELADDLAYGIVALRMRAEHQRMEQEVERQRGARYQSDKLATMGQLLAGVAHELNNPLSVVTGWAAILSQKLAGGPFETHTAKITDAAQRCARIVRNFLAMARQQPPERHRVALGQVVRDAVELLAYHLRLDDVEVIVDVPDDLPVIWADPHQLSQVVLNLITNAQQALQATPPPRRLTLTARSDTAGGRVRLDVADTGPGLLPEVRAKIFEPFFTTKPPGQGTGLGLALCQGIIEGHGGSIRVESQPGHGAVFQVELPVAPALPTEGDVEVVAKPASGRGKTMLVVDDEPEVADTLAEILALDGHRVETATGGVMALQKLQQRSYDFVLSDIRMPEIDGLGLYREIERSRPELLPRFAFFTGDVLRPETRVFIERTQVPWLSKPFDINELRRVIATVTAKTT